MWVDAKRTEMQWRPGRECACEARQPFMLRPAGPRHEQFHSQSRALALRFASASQLLTGVTEPSTARLARNGCGSVRRLDAIQLAALRLRHSQQQRRDHKTWESRHQEGELPSVHTQRRARPEVTMIPPVGRHAAQHQRARPGRRRSPPRSPPWPCRAGPLGNGRTPASNRPDRPRPRRCRRQGAKAPAVQSPWQRPPEPVAIDQNPSARPSSRVRIQPSASRPSGRENSA